MSATPNPLIAAFKQAQPLVAPPTPQLGMAPAPMALPVPTRPVVQSHSQAQLQSMQAKRDADVNAGPGVDQIHNPFLRALGRIGDVTASIFAPRVAEVIPGTTLHHEVQVGRENQKINQMEAEQKDQAQTEQEQAATGQAEANTEYLRQRPEIEQSKIDQKQQAVRDRVSQAAAARGQLVTWDDQGVPSFTDDTNSQAYRDHQALTELHKATADKDNINAEIAQNHYVPGTPEYAEAQRKLAQVDQRLQVAMAGLGLRRQGLGLQQQRLQSQLYGRDMQGNELPGVLHDEAGNPVGSAYNGNVKPTTQARDAASRAEDLTAIQSRIEEGLKDPEIREYLGPMGGRLAEAEGRLGTLPAKVAQFQNDLISYGAFQAGLHPVRGIGALEYFDKVMGGLHQTPEQLAGKLASNAATAGTVQQEGTMPTKAGRGRAANAPNPPALSQGDTQTFTDAGVTYRIPKGQIADFKKDHPNAR